MDKVLSIYFLCELLIPIFFVGYFYFHWLFFFGRIDQYFFFIGRCFFSLNRIISLVGIFLVEANDFYDRYFSRLLVGRRILPPLDDFYLVGAWKDTCFDDPYFWH